MEDHADRQRGLDRNVRVPELTSGLAAGRSSPGVDRVIRKPDREITATPEARLVLGPITHPVSRLRVLVLVSLRILDGC